VARVEPETPAAARSVLAAGPGIANSLKIRW
jgi:hypothetical protein